MKKLFLLIGILSLSLVANAQNLISTNILAGAGLHLISTNRIKVYSIEVSSTNSFNYRFFDNDNTDNVPTASTTGWWGTNFVSGAITTRTTYPTNYVVTFTNYNGYVNYKTNVGLWTLTTSVAQATNAASPLAVVATGGAETRVSYVNALFTRGVLLYSTGNGSITLYYSNER